eukprot:gene11225-15065_t
MDDLDYFDPDFLLFDDLNNVDVMEPLRSSLRRRLSADNREFEEYDKLVGSQGKKLCFRLNRIIDVPRLTSYQAMFDPVKYYSCTIEIENQIKSFNFFESERENSNKVKFAVENVSKINNSDWNFEDYFGPTPIKFTLYMHTYLSKKRKISCRLITLADMFRIQQDIENKSYNSINFDDLMKQDWLFKSKLVMHTNIELPIEKQSKNWLETAKKSTQKFNHHQNLLENIDYMASSVHPIKYANVTIEFSFRIISLSRCGSNAIKLNNNTIELSEFHILAMGSSSNIISDILLSLARKKSLASSLSLRSSNNYNALDFALLNGNEQTTLIILEKAGHLAFQNIKINSTSPLHCAIIGGSDICLEYLYKFLKKYCSQERRNHNNNNNNNINNENRVKWCPDLSVLVEWKDVNGHTPLSLACSMKGRDSMIDLLLLMDANVAYINSKTGYTPLMYASEIGSTAAVCKLLCLVKSASQVDESILSMTQLPNPTTGTNPPTTPIGITNHNQQHPNTPNTSSVFVDYALQTHLRNNRSSRNMLHGTNVLDGGYFNRLSLFRCIPTQCDINGKQAIHLALEGGYDDIVIQLLSIGMSLSDIDIQGNTIFHMIASKNNIKICKECIIIERNKWNKNQILSESKGLELIITKKKGLLRPNYFGKTPIHIAYDNKYFSLCLLLIESAIEIYDMKTLLPNDIEFIYNDIKLILNNHLSNDIIKDNVDNNDGKDNKYNDNNNNNKITKKSKSSNNLIPSYRSFFHKIGSKSQDESPSANHMIDDQNDNIILDEYYDDILIIDDYADNIDYNFALEKNPKLLS